MKRVYGGCFMYGSSQKRGIFCGTQKQAAEAVGCSVGYLRSYWCVTGNQKEIEIATAKPNTLFWCENSYQSDRLYFEAVGRIHKTVTSDNESESK